MSLEDAELPSDLADRLRSDGMSALSCTKLLQDGRVIGVLCFERSRPLPPWLRQGNGVLDILGDVVIGALQQRELASRKREFDLKLKRMERIWSVGMFASGIAHNFNNLLTVIGGQAEMAEDLVAPRSRAARHVEQISAAVRRGKAIVEDIFDFSRCEQKLPQPVDVLALLKDCVADLETLRVAGGLHILLLTDVPEACVLADPGQLHQVFLNVIQNAIQASARGGDIVVRLDASSSGSRRLSHGSLRPGQFVRVSVSDVGRGMAPAQLAGMFQPFFTTREDGTGLGLATAYQTVVEIGGAFHVSSAPEIGTTVEIWIPASDVERLERALGATVLVLGRDRAEMLGDEDLLAALGFEPVGFTSLDAASLAIRADVRRFDVLVIDQVVLEANGAVVQELLDLPGTDSPVVVSFSEGDMEPLPPFPVRGIAAMLKRPWRPTAVLAALAEVLPV